MRPRSHSSTVRFKAATIACLALLAAFDSRAGDRRDMTADAEPERRDVLLEEMGVTRWHQRGFHGQGIKVAVLDSGFRGYREALGKGLPRRVTVRSFRRDGNLEARDSQHGILCAEVVHAIAPRADLLFANWEPDSPHAFLQAVRWARDQGARVVTCSVIMPGWSDGEGGGPIHAVLEEILGPDHDAGSVICCASAGNLAQRHWTGPLQPRPSREHQWAPGQVLNRVIPWGTERVAVEVYGPVREGCVLQLRDCVTGQVIHEAELKPERVVGGTWGATNLAFEPRMGQTYALAIRCPRPKVSDTRIHVVVLGGTLELGTFRGSIAFPADGRSVVTLAAVDRTHARLAYSSCGPNSNRPKPDFAACVPFPIFSRPRPFAGTSAAAPQAAGLAALILSRHPEASRADVNTMLQSSAIDLEAPGHDCETGYGLLRLPAR